MFKIKLSKRQKVTLAVLILGLGILVVDRAFILPKSAPAGQADFSVQSSTQPASATAGKSAAESPLNDKLAKLEAIWADRNLDLRQTRDAFSVPGSRSGQVWQDGPDQGMSSISKSDPVSRFVMRHRLKAVSVSTDKTAAFIDDRFLSVGQELDGFRLVAVDKESATFEAGGKQVTLRLTSDR